MPVIKYKEQLKRVLHRPVFGVGDLINQGIPQPYAKKLLSSLAKSSTILRIERGKYTTLDDPIVVATHLTIPCYLSFWSALSIRRLTTQQPFAVEIVTTRPRFLRRITFSGTPLIYYTARPTMLYGYENILWKDHRVPVARPEKVIIDALYFHALPLDELDEVFSVTNPKLLQTYAKMTHDARIIAIVEEKITC